MDRVPAPVSSIYGPVPSWRVGWSLGVDLLLETSTCSFACVYCQLGKIHRHIGERRLYVPTDRLARDLDASDWRKADVVTFSGSGEPTLALNLGEAIHLVKERTHKPVVVLTNATLLEDPQVRRELRDADTVACKLDAASDEGLRRMNQPVEGVSLASIVRGIEALRAEHPGRVVLQCMFMPTNLREAEEVALLAARIRPHEIQLNTPRRPFALARDVDSRGNHGPTAAYPRRALRTVDEDGALRLEDVFRKAAPDVPIVSVYQPKAR